MSIGNFGTFTTARLGIYAAQKGLSVVGNNIANINTTGYTRQVLDQVSLSVGGSDLYRSQFDAKVGSSGAQYQPNPGPLSGHPLSDGDGQRGRHG